MQYREAVQTVVKRRKDALLDAQIHYDALLIRSPEFAAADSAYREGVLLHIGGKIKAAELEGLKRARDKVIKDLGAEKVLNPPYACKKCRDTGLTDNRICGCALKLVLASDENIEFPLQNFSSLNLSLFEESKRPAVARVAEELKIIVEKGTASKKKNLSLLGSAGTGKTFLAACTAGEAVALGRSVVFITAFTMVNRFLSYHTSFDTNKESHLMPLIDCDLLVIDDLGTESVYKNVTLEYFYHIVNERQLKARHTMITSNLSLDAVANRYGERTASRLFDKRLSYVREFDFDDIRKIKL